MRWAAPSESWGYRRVFVVGVALFTVGKWLWYRCQVTFKQIGAPGRCLPVWP